MAQEMSFMPDPEDQTQAEGTTPTEGAAAPQDSADAQAADVAASEPAADGESKDPAEGSSQSKLQKLIDDKYQGDEDAFVDGLYNQWNSTADMAKELKELRETLAQLKKPAEEPAEVQLADNPDIQWLNNQLEETKSERAELAQKRTNLLQDMAKAEAEANQLRGQLRNAEEFEKKSLERELRDAERESARLADKWTDLKRDERKLDKDAKAYGIQLDRAKKALQADLQEQQRSRADAVKEQKESLEEFMAAVKANAKELGIPDTNIKHMANTIRGELFFYLQSLLAKDPNAEGIDVAEAVKVRSRAYAKAMNLGKGKPAASTPGAPAGANGKATTGAAPSKVVPTPTPKNKAEADAWVRAVFMGKHTR